MEKRDQNKSLKRKLESKEEKIEKLQKEFERFKKRARLHIKNIGEDNLAATKKCKKEEEAR